jgi:hypothetical protein
LSKAINVPVTAWSSSLRELSTRSRLKPYAQARFLCLEKTLNQDGKGVLRPPASKFSDMSENLDNKKGKSRRKTKGNSPSKAFTF